MSDVTLEFLGEQMRRLLDGQRGIAETLDDMRQRLQTVEIGLVELRRDLVNLHADIVRIDHRLDRSDQRLARIERRLDLVET